MTISVKKRRSLTPSSETPDKVAADGLHATRRGGARRGLSARVTLTGRSGKVLGQVLEGWALNVSRGGVRVILEEKVDLGAEFDVTLSGVVAEGGPSPDASSNWPAPASDGRDGTVDVPSTGRIVWVQEEPDGVVAGIEFFSTP
jgi:hypothetical protein